jgi:hypothetical protein
MPTQNYKDVIINFVFSMHSRRFVLALITMFLALNRDKLNISDDTLQMITGIAASFVVGESIADAAKNRGVVSVGEPAQESTPAISKMETVAPILFPPRVPDEVENRVEMPPTMYQPEPLPPFEDAPEASTPALSIEQMNQLAEVLLAKVEKVKASA